jgi:hypothetical protein
MFGASRPKFKAITNNGRAFLYRLSFPFRYHSIKFHLIVNDDVGEPHIHPWQFTTFLLLGAYKEMVSGRQVRHLPLSLVRYGVNKRHKVKLYRVLGFKIPCLTVGVYSKKIQPWCERKELCDLCAPTGRCIYKEYWKAEDKKYKDRSNLATEKLIDP